jgi:hypothetical protein
MMKRAVIALFSALLMIGGAAACKKKSEPAEVGLASAAEPQGVTWKRIELPFGSLELPVDAGWNLVGGGEVQGPDGMVVVMQSQDWAVEKMDKFLTAFAEMQVKQSPKYEGKTTERGKVAGAPAARIEGAFDNGTRFATRDYLVFAKGKVIVVGARIPAEHAERLAGIVDHAVRTLQVK